jgi:C-terminal processing protease CtpA/Prc
MSRELVEESVRLLRTRYVFPEKAAAAAAIIEASLAAGEYADLDEAALGERLTAQMFDVCADKHLRVRPRDPDAAAVPSADEIDVLMKAQEQAHNYRIARVERLDGNVGYIDLRGVADPSAGGPAIAAAMELVAHTLALIIDLRRNRGGSPDGVTFWNSYLFPDSMTHLNSIFDAESGRTKQFWSLPWLPGRRYTDRPVFVLTSDITFSAGEEFAYNLKALGRATLVGETTRGGAHPTTFFPLSASMEITVPIARSINPITGTNWEGTGVEPDVAMPAGKAYDEAYRRALRHVLASDTLFAVHAEARAALAGLDGTA